MQVKTATGKQYAVTAGHPLAAQAAAAILRSADGNAVDAAIAGAAVLAVASPHACSLGGDCFALLHSGGTTWGMNASGRSPAGLPDDASPAQLATGPLSCAVPGVLGGWEAMHRRFGRMAWPRLFDVAIGLAREGVPVSGELAAAMRAWHVPLARDPGCRALFLRDGAPDAIPYAAGETLRQPALADTLDAIASEGASALYQGHLGRALCRRVADAQGVLAPDDLR